MKLLFNTLAFTLFLSPLFAQPTFDELFYKDDPKGLQESYRQSIQKHNKEIQLNPQDAQAYASRGNAKSGLEDYRGAILDFSKAIELEPNGRYYYYRGLAKSNLNDFAGAILDFDKAVEQNARALLKYTYLERGLAKINMGQKDSGCLDLSKAGELGHENAYSTIRKLCN